MSIHQRKYSWELRNDSVVRDCKISKSPEPAPINKQKTDDKIFLKKVWLKSRFPKETKKSGFTPLVESAAESCEMEPNFFIILQMTCTEKILGSAPETSLMLACFYQAAHVCPRSARSTSSSSSKL